jgi:hypothetical protein
MLSDASLYDACPDFVSVGSLLKAHPTVEGDRRILYFEASNEGVDQQNEVIAAKALSDASDFFLRYGNIDIDHYTLIGAKLGIPDYPAYEIGRPVDVGQRGASTFEGRMADKANMVWSSMVDLNPPQRWYPSVGGQVLAKSIEVDPTTKARKAVVSQVRWSNVGLSKTPVNQHVGTCETVPVGVFAKALTAGYGSDSAALAGGGALRIQSIDTGVKSYWDFREKLAGDVRGGLVQNPTAKTLVDHAAEKYGLSRDVAAGHVERFMRDLKQGLKG